MIGISFLPELTDKILVSRACDSSRLLSMEFLKLLNEKKKELSTSFAIRIDNNRLVLPNKPARTSSESIITNKTMHMCKLTGSFAICMYLHEHFD